MKMTSTLMARETENGVHDRIEGRHTFSDYLFLLFLLLNLLRMSVRTDNVLRVESAREIDREICVSVLINLYRFIHSNGMTGGETAWGRGVFRTTPYPLIDH